MQGAYKPNTVQIRNLREISWRKNHGVVRRFWPMEGDFLRIYKYNELVYGRPADEMSDKRLRMGCDEAQERDAGGG